MVKMVNLFFNNYILHEKKCLCLRQSDTEMRSRQVQYKDSSSQENGHNCGIFAVTTILHLVEEHILLTSKLFSQTPVTK